MSDVVATDKAPETKDSRKPCEGCGASMEGEHHAAKRCESCRSRGAPPPPEKHPIRDEPTPKVDPSPPSSAVKASTTAIKASPSIPTAAELGPQHEYWMGVIENCPIQNITAGGRTFQKRLGPIEGDDTPVFRGPRGARVMLSDKEVKAIVEGVERRVLRPFGKSAKILIIGATNYRPDPRDEPIGRYLYLHRITEGLPFNFMEADPEPMVG